MIWSVPRLLRDPYELWVSMLPNGDIVTASIVPIADVADLTVHKGNTLVRHDHYDTIEQAEKRAWALLEQVFSGEFAG